MEVEGVSVLKQSSSSNGSSSSYYSDNEDEDEDEDDPSVVNMFNYCFLVSLRIGSTVEKVKRENKGVTHRCSSRGSGFKDPPKPPDLIV